MQTEKNHSNNTFMECCNVNLFATETDVISQFSEQNQWEQFSHSNCDLAALNN